MVFGLRMVRSDFSAVFERSTRGDPQTRSIEFVAGLMSFDSPFTIERQLAAPAA
jgi:hypothetical protein